MMKALSAGLAILLVLAHQIPAQAQIVTDLGLDTGFQDLLFDHHKRGRANIAADFDLDGWIDFYIGNPSEQSFVIRNAPGVGNERSFDLVQVLVTGELSWGGAAADYDNDGDYDIFISSGGNEGIGFDRLFQNQWIESGETALSFVDVSAAAGITGPVPPAASAPIETASANAVWRDYDRDGDVDLFVNTYIQAASTPELLGRNTLWQNNGDGTFDDVTDTVGLGVTRRATMHSTFFDMDNDGDADLFESNFEDGNVLWRNRLVETGTADFEDVTALFSPPGEDISFPDQAFASAAADFDNDGWEDLVVFMRGPGPEPGSPYPAGHAIFLNQAGAGFVNVAASSEINGTFQPSLGAMGCQVGDINGDGVPDLFVGSGGPFAGSMNPLHLSDSAVGASPHYQDRSDLIDFAAPEASTPPIIYPPHPYRTHGAAFVDVDGDGGVEVAVVNGGPTFMPDVVRAPNRLFKFEFSPKSNYFKVRPVGDGVNVSLDAIGTRFAVTVQKGTGPTWTIYRTLYAGSAFSAQHGFEVHFGLADADTIVELEVTWPDGTVLVDRNQQTNTTVVVSYNSDAGRIPPTLKMAKSAGDLAMVWEASCMPSDSDYAIYEGVLDRDFSDYLPQVCSTAGAITHSPVEPTGSYYYLVVPSNSQNEGSYGGYVGGGERPASTSPCAPQAIGCP